MLEREPGTVLICRCLSRGHVPPEAVAELRESLAAEEAGAVIVDDLCSLAADGDGEALPEAVSAVIACHPRAVRGLLSALGRETDNVACLDLRSGTVHSVVEALNAVEVDRGARDATPADRGDARDAWFPVIDRGRCTACGACADFCLFGVYDREPSGDVRVARPDNCKDNCPACARICPAVAVIFPKSTEEPINGAEVTAESLASGRVKMKPEQLGRGDIVSFLRRRMAATHGAASPLRQDVVEKALRERREHLGRAPEPRPNPQTDGEA